MSKKKLKTIANLARAAGVFMALLAAVTAIVWSRFPQQVFAFEAWLQRMLVGGYQEAWDAARAQRDPVEQVAELETLLERLAAVHKDDHLAGIVRDCMQRLADLARTRDDLPGAVEWMRAATLFDDHDVTTAAELGNLLCQVPGLRQEGIDHLARLAAQFPAHPLVIPVLVRHLIADGQARGALRVLDATDAVPRSNLWTIEWDAGTGFDETARAEVVPIVDGELFRLRFLVGHEWQRLRFWMPAGSCGTLYSPKLTVTAGDVYEVIDVATACNEASELLVGQGRIQALGSSSPRFDIGLPQTPDGLVDVALEARWQLNRSPVLAGPATAPEMAELADELLSTGATNDLASLQRWRLAALNGAMEMSWRSVDEDFVDARRTTIAAPLVTDRDRLTFDVTFAVPPGTAEVRFGLPPFAGFRYRLLSIDPAGLLQSGRHDLDVLPDGVLLTSGADPFVTFAIPATTLTSLHIVGDVR